jgi:archaellum component FlaC
MFEGMIEKVNRIQTSIDNLTMRVMALSNDIQINLEYLETRLNSKLDTIKDELRSEMLIKGVKA